MQTMGCCSCTNLCPDSGDSGSLGFLWFNGDDEGEDEEEQLSVQQETSSRQKQEDLRDPDYQIPSRL